MSKDSNWYTFQDFIKANFPDSNLHPAESFITHTNHLRFELGDGFENGTIERVDHCVKKAVKIFESVFNDEDEVYILTNSFENDGGGEFYKSTNAYLEAQFSYFDEIIKDENTVITSETDELYNIEKEISEIMTITTHHIQKIFKVDLSSVNYSRITLKSIQCDWDKFFVASVIAASKENLYQSHTAIMSRFYFELTICQYS